MSVQCTSAKDPGERRGSWFPVPVPKCPLPLKLTAQYDSVLSTAQRCSQVPNLDLGATTLALLPSVLGENRVLGPSVCPKMPTSSWFDVSMPFCCGSPSCSLSSGETEGIDADGSESILNVVINIV